MGTGGKCSDDDGTYLVSDHGTRLDLGGIAVSTCTYVLLEASSVIVLVLDRSEKIQTKDLVKQGLGQLSSRDTSLGGRSECLGSGDKANSEDSRGLHVDNDNTDLVVFRTTTRSKDYDQVPKLEKTPVEQPKR